MLQTVTNKKEIDMSSIVQSQFFKFNETIKLVDGEDHAPVREKRDALIQELNDYLKAKAEKEGKPKITFRHLSQGSYFMGNGVKPMHEDEDYDIDVRLAFDISKGDYTPLEVKKWVFEAFNKLNRKVIYKKPCVRVQYTENGFAKFHIDFACYADGDKDIFGKAITYLSKGKPGDAEAEIKWERADPDKLKTLIDDAHRETEEGREQFLRITRDFKRWKDNKFPNTDKGRPIGIAFTVMALKGFRPAVKDEVSNSENIDDLKALIGFTKFMLDQFGWASNRISYDLPVEPFNDLFKKMTDAQSKNFKQKLENLKKSLEEASTEPDPHEACKILQKEFGEDFPVPPKSETGQQRRKPVVGVNESA